MPVQSADVLNWASLTPVVNEMKAPNSFLKNFIWGNDQTKPARNIELSFIRRGRKIAPFVERNGEAIMVDGANEEFRTISPAHIRIKKPMTPSDLLDRRRPGSVIHVNAGNIRSAMQEYIAREQRTIMDDIENSEEYLCSLALTGTITYEAADEASFTVTFPRDAAHDITLTGADLWSASTSVPRVDFLTAAQLVNDAVSLNVTDVIMGADAADAFLAHAEVTGAAGLLETRRLITGSIDLTNQFLQSGAMFLGEYVHGIRVWRYARQVGVGSSTVDLIRPKYVEFVARTPAAQFVTYYGAIEDMKAIGSGRVLQSKRFSKSWEIEDPSSRMLLVESNPLPVLRRPDASVSVKVLA